MKIVLFIAKIALFAVLFAFASANQHLVQVQLLPQFSVQLPLVVLVLICMALGVALGFAVLWPGRLRQRRALRHLQRQPASPSGKQRHTPRAADSMLSASTSAASRL